jgi:GH15 family glucan-1,4-alpha-glucosidase
MLQNRILFLVLAACLLWRSTGYAQNAIKIDHRYTNIDAQSLIGLPTGSHKTIVDKRGNLKWSQWNLKRRPLDSPIGFSDQMDGELAIEGFAGADNSPLVMQTQSLYQGRYPFVVTKLSVHDVTMEELAFAVDPEQDPAVFPGAHSGAQAMDVVQVTLTNHGTAPMPIAIKLSGRERNLPAHASVQVPGMATLSGEDLVLMDHPDGLQIEATQNNLALKLNASLEPKETRTVWLRLPYEFPVSRNAELSRLPGNELLSKATAQWDAIWARGARVHYANQQLNDFFDSSIAYVLILTEYDANGDLWTLDGPGVYRQYWGRGELFQARALEVAGYLNPARESIEHAFHIQMDDGEWDGPPASGWPAWDNSGGNAGAVWDYYLYTHDIGWLKNAYPYLLSASRWIKAHREETTVEDVAGTPEGAKPIHRMISSKCRPEPTPPLAPGEKTYWYGLLPWSYGDSGLPEGHSYSHNFLAAYAIRVTAEAARALGKQDDADWLDREYATYVADIRNSINRSVSLEKISPKYLPAMPTLPDGAYSQTFLAITPTQIYSPTDPLVDGLLTRMEKEESQGLPTNVAWAGYAGVWPGEAMNIAETYLLRNDVEHTTGLLLAAINHSYTTNAFKEEILTDVTKERACNTPHSKRENGEGTGDMPEAWGSANTVNLMRDMLVQERYPAPDTTGSPALHLFAGLPTDWIAPGEDIAITNTPTTFGTTVSVGLHLINPNEMEITIDSGSRPTNLVLHVPVSRVEEIKTIRVNGKSTPVSQLVAIPQATNQTKVLIELFR